MKKIKKLSLYKTVVSNLTPDETNQLRGGTNYTLQCSANTCLCGGVSAGCSAGCGTPYTQGCGGNSDPNASILICNTNNTICITRVCNPTYTK